MVVQIYLIFMLNIMSYLFIFICDAIRPGHVFLGLRGATTAHNYSVIEIKLKHESVNQH